MDVDRLMRDLTVEQLENIQQDLETKMEGKRESLREMVGRRYRDVLEASSEVRNVCSLADQLAKDIANTRINYQTQHVRSGSKDEQKAGEHFLAVSYLISNIGSDDGEPLDDVVALCMVEHLQKQLISNHSSPMIHKIARALTGRIVATRSELEDLNIATLSDVGRSDWAVNQLTAIAVLQTKDVAQLLDLYLEKRLDFICQLIEDSATILTIVEEIKKTLIVVEELFVHGELQHAIQSVCNGQFKCELIREMCADQAYSFEKTMNEDIEKVWRYLREKMSGRFVQATISTQQIAEKCSVWIEKACAATHRLVAEVCEYFDNLDQMIELLQAITSSLKNEWPRIGANRVVYEKLLQSVVVDKSQKLLVEWIENVEKTAKQQFETTNDGPSTSLFDERTYRADSQAHIGISTQLYRCVKTLWECLESINEKCHQFETICSSMSDSSTIARLKTTLATSVHQVLLRLCETTIQQVDNDECSTTKSRKCLSKVRLALALIHSDAALVCQLLDKDSQRITSLNQRLHRIVENSLSELCAILVNDTITKTTMSEYLQVFDGGMYALRLVTEFQTVELADVGDVHVPIAVSSQLVACLFEICEKLAAASVAHLLSKKIRREMGELIAKRFEELIRERVEQEKEVEEWNLPTRTTLQVLFDVQVLNALFSSDGLRKLCSSIESHLDPFDVSLLAPLLATNVKLAHVRTQIMFSSLITETVSNKDVQLAASYSKVQDLVVHIEQPSRIPMIPRLDRDRGENKKTSTSRSKANRYLANPNQQAGSKSTPSLSAFYDRISSSWFGGANN